MKKLNLAIALFFLLLVALPTQAQFYGTVSPSSVVDIKFTTRDSTGLPTTLSGSPVIKCYKSNDTATETTTGVTLTADFDSITGLNNLRVDTSADTSFYGPQNNIACVVTAGTVSSVSVVGETVAQFRMSSDYTVQKGVAFSNFPFWMLSSNSGAITGITPSCTIQKDSGAFASTSNSPSEVASGKYRINLTATELNANVVALICTGSGAVTSRSNIYPQQ